MRARDGDFASKPLYKKWYKKVSPLSMLNFMLFNAYFAWNISAETMLPNCLKVTNSSFYAALSEKLFAFTERIEDIHGGEL